MRGHGVQSEVLNSEQVPPSCKGGREAEGEGIPLDSLDRAIAAESGRSLHTSRRYRTIRQCQGPWDAVHQETGTEDSLAHL